MAVLLYGGAKQSELNFVSRVPGRACCEVKGWGGVHLSSEADHNRFVTVIDSSFPRLSHPANTFPEMADISKRQKTVVVGAGPVGALAALYAAKRGHDVEVYELRSGASLPWDGRLFLFCQATSGIDAILNMRKLGLFEFLSSCDFVCNYLGSSVERCGSTRNATHGSRDLVKMALADKSFRIESFVKFSRPF